MSQVYKRKAVLVGTSWGGVALIENRLCCLSLYAYVSCVRELAATPGFHRSCFVSVNMRVVFLPLFRFSLDFFWKFFSLF